MAGKEKVVQKKECKDKQHTFIVTRWFTSGGRQKAVDMRCQHCLQLMRLDEIEAIEWKEAEGIDV